MAFLNRSVRTRRIPIVQAASALATESLAFAEFGQLLADPVYYGVGVGRGDGRQVVVLPGLFGNDWYLYPFRTWLRRIGFHPVRSSLAFNAGCPERLSRQVEREIERQQAMRPGRVILIGHSRGGILARATAARMQDGVSHLVLLGSPVGYIEAMARWPEPRSRNRPGNPAVARAGDRARSYLDPECDVPYCDCPFPQDIRRGLHPRTEVVSIFSRSDPVVPAAACRIRGAHNVEVGGTHTGLVYNGDVYRRLAGILTNRRRAV